MSVVDFADYRMRMRAGVPSRQRSYYLVGLTHGVRRGTVDLDLRRHLSGAIRAVDPHAVVHDPVETWHRTSAPEGADRLDEFHRLTGLASGSEVCIAWLPDRDAVTDAAAELQAAHRGGATVVAITGENDDFLVRAFASIVLPDLDAFGDWVRAA
ncbi:hypothetical protein [Actinophytocola oryzae]|uniref:Uncharacterized protein n=1 Tax=Actinophytocola oryzae TaxID=502181 RepID=A0A4R7VFN5_9PSEU|nr:hypothetical protein [Actinophytocola oryzae]TDV47915.1 hypothetical protein CLV71_109150 [Actinophytocola oryzae]